MWFHFTRMYSVPTLSVLILLGILALLVVPRPADAEVLRDVYLLGSGDQLRITVFGEPDLSGEFFVDGAGSVSLPLIGEVHALGLSVRQFELQVVAMLGAGYLVDPKVNVEVLNFRPFFILGEVKSPGKFPFIDGITVLNAVAMAGGYTHRARLDRTEIVRGGDPGKTIMNAPESALVMPGDIIRIPERFF